MILVSWGLIWSWPVHVVQTCPALSSGCRTLPPCRPVLNPPPRTLPVLYPAGMLAWFEKIWHTEPNQEQESRTKHTKDESSDKPRIKTRFKSNKVQMLHQIQLKGPASELRSKIKPGSEPDQDSGGPQITTGPSSQKPTFPTFQCRTRQVQTAIDDGYQVRTWTRTKIIRIRAQM